MLKTNLSKQAAKFLKSLPAKQAKQLARKLLQLREHPFPQDSKKLTNSNYHRVDVGEYRIVYFFNESILEVLLIGKRNDNEVYKKLTRLINR